MNDQSGEDFVRLLVNDALKNLPPSSRNIRQRRWRQNRKNKPYSPSSPVFLHSNQQVEDANLCSPFIDDQCSNDNSFSGDDNDRYPELNPLLFELDEFIISDEIDEPLYPGALIKFKQFHKKILEFGNIAKLNNSHMNKLLKLIAEGLPPGHKLVKSHAKLTELFQEKASFQETTRCIQCLQIIDEKNKCSILCEQNGIQRRAENVIEHVFMNKFNQQLIHIIRRNKELIIDYPQASNHILPCDIISSTIYQAKVARLQTAFNDTYPITLMIHTDGTPICHWTKKHTWVVMGSVIEIPPPLRENQTNMVLFGLWNGPRKPDPDVLLAHLCDSIKQILVVDGIKFYIDVQLFKGDLPARALACKHINHNGYYACLECDQEGVWSAESKTILYPFNQNQVNLRTPAHFDLCREMARRSSTGQFFGVKGTSALSKILDIPTQIDLDIMHLSFIGHCSLLMDRWKEMVVAQAWLSVEYILGSFLLEGS